MKAGALACVLTLCATTASFAQSLTNFGPNAPARGDSYGQVPTGTYAPASEACLQVVCLQTLLAPSTPASSILVLNGKKERPLLVAWQRPLPRTAEHQGLSHEAAKIKYS